MIPLIFRLKKESHRIIAKGQDLIVETLYEVFDKAVLHGGTGIWRCYGGNRFSEDVDVYINRDLEKLSHLFRLLEKKGFVIEKKKIGQNSLYSSLKFRNKIVRFEALFKKSSGILKDYEKVDGNFITVYSLSAYEFINEKIETYLKRLKIRDLYDIFFLLRHVKDDSVKSNLKRLINSFKEPVDEADLRVLILEGIIPNKNKMLEYIQDRI